MFRVSAPHLTRNLQRSTNLDNGDVTRIYEDAMLGQDRAGIVFPMFRREAIRNEKKSIDAGRPMYDTIEMIQIIIPGDNKSAPVRLIKESDKVRFADAYERFKREEEMVFDGTPVEAWPRLETRMVYALKAQNFFTVESIAECSDANLSKLGLGGIRLRELARAYIEAARNGGHAERLAIENAQQREEMAAMAQAIENLKDTIAKMAKDTKTDITTINVDAALSVARDVVTESRKAALPADWREYKVREMIELYKAHVPDAAVHPRNREEALQMLGEYEATLKAVAA
jgi:hypothetical protein